MSHNSSADRYSTLSRSRVWKRCADVENGDVELKLKVTNRATRAS